MLVYGIHFDRSDMEEQQDFKKGKKQKSKDFYWENGLMIFTKEYLLKRKYCCKSGCRHCPYGFNERG